jgi:hypothetical protein
VYWPLAVALASVLVLLAFVVDLASRLRDPAATTLRPGHFAVVAPAVFACQELLERGVQTHTFPIDAVADRTFLVGLALQLPFALLAYGAARWLLRVSASLALRLAPRPVARCTVASIHHPGGLDVPARLSLVSRHGPRGPPRLALIL